MKGKIQEIKTRRSNVASLLGGSCCICGKKFGKNFHFHHIQYVIGQKKHSDFKNWLDYNDYVLPLIIQKLEQFSLLCKTCHHLITILQSIKDEMRFERVVDLARRSRN